MANTFRKVYKKSYTPGGNVTYEMVRTVGVNGVELDLMKGCTHINDGEIGLVPKPVAGQEDTYLRGDGTWNKINIPTYTTMTGCSSNKDGVRGLVPQPMQGQQNLFLAGDGNFKKPSLGVKTNDDNTKSLVMNIGNETVSEVEIAKTIPTVTEKTNGILSSLYYNRFADAYSTIFNLPKTIAYIISDEFTTQTYTGYNGATETFTFTVKTPAKEDGTDPTRKYYIGKGGNNLVGAHVFYPLLSVQCTNGVDVTSLKPKQMDTIYHANDDGKGWYYEHTITFTAGIINHKTENSAGKFRLICQMLLVENYAYDSDDNDIYTYPHDFINFKTTYDEKFPAE